MKKWVWVLPLLFLMVSCGPSTQSGVNKEYDVRITVQQNSTATFFMGVDADTAAEALAGDAPASASTELPVSVALKGAQASASGDESSIEGGKPINYEPVDNSTENPPAPPPVVPPVVVPTDPAGPPPVDPDPTDPDEPNMEDYDIVDEAPCVDGRCMFTRPGTDYGESFLVQWTSGNILAVPDSTSAAGSLSTGMRYEPWPTGAVVYAEEGDNSRKASILIKKSDTVEYQTKFHHTTTASSDGGKSLVLCPGDETRFDRCESNGVEIPYHGYDNNRVIYWNMNEEPTGPIVCEKDGKKYTYPAGDTIVYGVCS